MDAKTLPIINTPRTVLRWISEHDVDSLYEIFSDPQVMRYWSTVPLPNREAAAELQDREFVHQHFADGRQQRLLVLRLGDLRLRIEAADSLERIAEEIETQRLGRARRKHVNQAAAHSEYSADSRSALFEDAPGSLSIAQPGSETEPALVTASLAPCAGACASKPYAFQP